MMGEATGDSWQAENNRRAKNLAGWSIAWLGGTALLAFGPKYLWDYSTLPTLGAVLLNLVVGLAMVMALVRYISGLDELERKIFLDAAGLTLGVTLVCGSCYELLEDVKLIPYQPEISHLFYLMVISFAVSVFVGNRRYK
jgi:hypothetical protein